MNTGYVYKLGCLNVNVTDIYVGSTKSLRNRKQSHKQGCETETNRSHHYPVYECIRANGGWVNWDLVVIETVTYNEKYELRARERYWLETLKASLNSKIPTRTKPEWREENKEKIRKSKSEYYQENKPLLQEQRKARYEENKERYLAQNREYQERNKDVISAKHAEYRRENAEAIKANKSRQVVCECGITYTHCHESRHRRTARHIALISIVKSSTDVNIPTQDGELGRAQDVQLSQETVDTTTREESDNGLAAE